MGAFAEFEYAFIMERQREGIEIAKRQGRYTGSKKKLSAEKIEILKLELQTRKTKTKIAKELGISRPSLYNYIEQIK